MSIVSVSIGSAKNIFRYEEDDHAIPLSLIGIAASAEEALVSDASGNLTLQPVSVNTWQRVGTTISPINAGDDLDMGTGQIDCDTLVVDTSVGVGIASPLGNLHIRESQNGVTNLIIDNVNAGANAITEIEIRNGAAIGDALILRTMGTGFTTNGAFRQDTGVVEASTNLLGGLNLLTRSASPIRFFTGGFADANERMTILSAGSVALANDLILTGGGDIGTDTDLDLLSLTDNALTVNGSITCASLAAIGGSIQAGLSDTTAGTISVFGSAGTAGGKVVLYNGATKDTEVNSWEVKAGGFGNFVITGFGGTSGLGDVITLDRITGGLSLADDLILIGGGDIGTATDPDLLQLTDGDLLLNGFLRVNSNTMTLHTTGNTVFEMGHDSLAHGVTDFASTNAACRIESVAGTDGRARILGFSTGNAVNPFTLIGIFGSTTPDDTVPAVIISGAKRTGATITDLAALETILQVQTSLSVPLVTVLGDGKTGFGVPVPTTAVDVSGEVTVNAKAKITSIGGYAIKLTNEIAAAAATTKGALVEVNAGFNNAFQNAGSASIAVIGITLDSGVANGEEAWIVVSGIAEVLADSSGFTRGDRLIASGTNAGAAEASNAPAVAVHFQEIGHALETAGAGVLGKVVPHFN